METNIDKKEIQKTPLDVKLNQTVSENETPSENNTQKNPKTDLKKLITKIDNRVKTKVITLKIKHKKKYKKYFLFILNIIYWIFTQYFFTESFSFIIMFTIHNIKIEFFNFYFF